MSSFIQSGDAFSYFSQASDVPLLSVQTPHCQALISLQGAQLLQFRSQQGHQWLYCPNGLVLQQGRAIDAGIPLCLPWFGRHTQTNFPIHGYLRQQLWRLDAANYLANGAVQCEFSFHHQPSQQFPFELLVKHRIYLHQQLNLELECENLSTELLPLSFAWHSYWQTSQQSYLQGLEQHSFLDNRDKLQSKLCTGAILCDHAMDKVFEAANTVQTLYNPDFALQFSSQNCPTRIVWQPQANAGFSCIEHGFAFADSMVLNTGETAYSRLTIKEL